MKKLIFTFSLLFAAIPAGMGASVPGEFDRLWDEAGTAYLQSDFQQAAVLYDSILMAGYASEKLYYNLGNAYFKDGQIGKAVLNYSRAARLNPTDSDIRYNMRVANANVVDQIEIMPEFFLTTWMRNLRHSLSSNAWAWLSLLMFAVALAAVMLFLLASGIKLRKTGFYVGIIGAVLFIFTLSFSLTQRKQLIDSNDAVIMHSAVPVKSSPDNESRDMFILHEGTMVEIVGTLGDWREILLTDGNKGWIQAAVIEVI